MPEPLYEDLFLCELLEWFNTQFFSWVDKIQCKVCSKSKSAENSSTENGVRVEVCISIFSSLFE